MIFMQRAVTASAFVFTMLLLAIESTYWGLRGEQLYGGALYWPSLAAFVLAGVACCISAAHADLVRRIDAATERTIGQQDLAYAKAVAALAASRVPPTPEPRPSPIPRPRLRSVPQQR